MNETVLLNLPLESLGPIGKMLRGHLLHDIVTESDGLTVVCTDGLAVRVKWGDNHAELASYHDGEKLSPAPTMPPAFRYVCGKLMDSAYSDGGLFKIAFSDGHVIRFQFHTHGVMHDGVDAIVQMPIPEAGQLIASMLDS